MWIIDGAKGGVLGEHAGDVVTGSEEAEAGQRSPSREELSLLERWDALQSGFRRLTDLVLRDVQGETGLAPSSFQALWFLLTTPEQSAPAHQLATTLGFTTAGTTKVTDRLVEAGLVERHPSPSDRRVMLASLTEPGIEMAVTAALTLADTLRDRVVSPLGDERLTVLTDAVRALDPEPRRSV